MLMNQGRGQKFMEDRGLGSQKWLNPQCFPQKMRKGCQKPFNSCEAASKAISRAFLVGEWSSRQAKKKNLRMSAFNGGGDLFFRDPGLQNFI